MTCKQLYGPCEVLIHGETAEEMIKNSQKHAMEMVAKGDKVHIEAKSAFIATHKVKKDLWEKNMWIEPQNTTVLASKQGYSDPSSFYGAEERI